MNKKVILAVIVDKRLGRTEVLTRGRNSKVTRFPIRNEFLVPLFGVAAVCERIAGATAVEQTVKGV